MVAALTRMLTSDEPRQRALRLLSTAMAERLLDPSCDLDQVLLASSLDRSPAERDRLCELRLHCLEALSGRLAAAGRYGAAVDALTVINELQRAQRTLPNDQKLQRPLHKIGKTMVSRKKIRRVRIILILAVAALAGGGIPAGLLLTSSTAQAAPKAHNAPMVAADSTVDLTKGAVFLQSNIREGNQVVAYARHANGTLTKVGTFPTGGGGSGSFEDSSDGLILASPQAQAAPENLGGKPEFLFAVDAGTSDIAVFKVEPTKLQLVGDYPSNGQTPVSLTVSHGVLYVLNSGKYDNREFDQVGNALENCASGYSQVAATGVDFNNGDQQAVPSITGF